MVSIAVLAREQLGFAHDARLRLLTCLFKGGLARLGGGWGRGKGCGHLWLSEGRGFGVLVPGHLTIQLTLGQLDVLAGAFAKGVQHARILLHQTAFRSINADTLFVGKLF